MPASETTEKFCLNDENLETLVTAILNKVNQRIAQRIVSTVDATSDGAHVPSALAIYQLVSKLNHASMQTITGPLPDDGESNVIYLQRNTKADPNWNMYVFVNDTWVPLGSTSINLEEYFSKNEPSDIEELKTLINLSNYWTKSDSDINALKVALSIPSIQPITTEMITTAVNRAFVSTEPSI